MIQVEAAGPDLPEVIYIRPDRFVAMAEWVFTSCVQSPGGAIGGFITSDVTALEDYIISPGISLDQRYRKPRLPAPGFQFSRPVWDDINGVLLQHHPPHFTPSV